MITISVEEAFTVYEAVRHRLPPALPKVRPSRNLPSLETLADEFDVFLLDAYGVLNIGDSAIPGTRGRIEDLRAAGKQVRIISNAASVPCSDLVVKYRRLGYDFGLHDIVTSRDTLVASLDGMRGLHWGLMAADASRIDDLGELRSTLLQDDPSDYDAVDGFLLIGSSSWTEDRQRLLEASVTRDPRPVLVANPDVAAPREHGFTAEPGHFAHRLADRSGIVPKFFGKPFRGIFDIAFGRLPEGTEKSRMLMVGDSLHTDVLGAQAAGIASALIAGYGFLSGQDVDAAIRCSGIVPDYVLERP